MRDSVRRLALVAALVPICTGCEDRGFWHDCTGRVNPWGPTRRVRERVECYCPEGYICHEDWFPRDAAVPDADLDAAAVSATHDASDATPADARLDGSMQDTMVSEDAFVTQDAIADRDGGGVTEIDGGP
jgi:hypothetical protein